jgi:putative transposase
LGEKSVLKQIINYLRKAKVFSTICQVYKKIEVTEQTFNRLRKEYDSLKMDQEKGHKNEYEKENTPLKKLIVDLSLDKAILKKVAERKY